MMGPLVGSDPLGWHSVCSCGHRVDADSRDELRRAHQRHAGSLATESGVARARQALADTLTRGKPMPPTTELETTR